MAWTSRELIAAKKEGAVIRTVLSAGYGEAEVIYEPKGRGDRKPWRVKGLSSWDSVTASQCRPVGPNGGPWALARALRIDVR